MFELSLKQQYSCGIHIFHFLIAHNRPIKLIQRNLTVKYIICLKNKTILSFPQCFCIPKNKRTNTKIQLREIFQFNLILQLIYKSSSILVITGGPFNIYSTKNNLLNYVEIHIGSSLSSNPNLNEIF